MRRIFGLVVSICLATAVRADGVSDLTLEEKTDQSDMIVRAECTGLRSEWVNGRIVTRAQFSVSRDLMQAGTQQIEITTLGGVAEHPVLKVRVRSTVSEQPEIHLRDQAILFTRRTRTGERMLIGGRQGFVRLTPSQVQDAPGPVVRSERRVTINPERAAAPAQRRAQNELRVESEPVTANDFEARVRGLIATRAQRVRAGAAR